MRRLVVLVSAVVILAMPAVSFAINGTDKSKPKSARASGEATAVAPDSLTVKGKTGEWKFTIDKNTVVSGGGATHTSLALKAEGKASTLTEYVKVGDGVTVTYVDKGADKLAENVRVNKPAAKK
jgi:hypothetical protein